MKTRSWKVPGLIVAGALTGWVLSTLTAEARGDGEAREVLALVGSAEVTRAEVERTSHERFIGLARQHEELTQQSLIQAVRIKLVEVEAAARGISSQQLVEEEVFGRTPEPTVEEVEAVFRRSGARVPLQHVEAQIRANLKIQAQEKRYEEFLGELRERHPVVNRMEPMRAVVADRGFPSRGADDARVTIVEFGDFQCPYCRQLVGVLGQVMDAYGDQIRLVYRNFPLTAIHPGAQVAAEASLCAQEQGKFWELHDEMYANPAAISASYLKGTARRLGFDGEQFDGCLDSEKYREQVATDERDARQLGLTGTPGLFINGRFLAGVPDAEKIVEIVLDELNRTGNPIEARPLEPIRMAVAAEGFPARGPADAPVTIVEFADFQCPFCLRILPALEKVTETYGDQVRFVYRQYPIAQLHPEAQKAAEASLCADEQGKFWEMHDAMFANQDALQVPALKKTARSLGLDGASFDVCLDSDRFAEAALEDLDAGRRAGVTGTPTLFINGRMLDGLQSFEAVAAVIDDELSRARK